MSSRLVIIALILQTGLVYGQEAVRAPYLEDSLWNSYIDSLLKPMMEFDEKHSVKILSPFPDSVLENSHAFKLRLIKDTDTAREYAREDIRNNTLFLLRSHKGLPTVSAERIKFEMDYKVCYYSYRDSLPNIEVQKAYNSVMLEKIYMRYGKRCISKVDKDVVGLKEWGNNSKSVIDE